MPPRARTTKPSQSTGEPTTTQVEKAIEVIETPDDILDEPRFVDDEDRVIPDEFQFSTADLPEPPAPTDDDTEVLTVDGTNLLAMRPEPSAWNLLIGSFSDDATSADKARSLQTFINHVFDERSRMYINRRLLTRGDKFDQDFLERIVVTLIEKWTPDVGTNRKQRRQTARKKRR